MEGGKECHKLLFLLLERDEWKRIVINSSFFCLRLKINSDFTKNIIKIVFIILIITTSFSFISSSLFTNNIILLINVNTNKKNTIGNNPLHQNIVYLF